jgi:type VI protein secretion system component VasA
MELFGSLSYLQFQVIAGFSYFFFSSIAHHILARLTGVNCFQNIEVSATVP